MSGWSLRVVNWSWGLKRRRSRKSRACRHFLLLFWRGHDRLCSDETRLRFFLLTRADSPSSVHEQIRDQKRSERLRVKETLDYGEPGLPAMGQKGPIPNGLYCTICKRQSFQRGHKTLHNTHSTKPFRWMISQLSTRGNTRVSPNKPTR